MQSKTTEAWDITPQQAKALLKTIDIAFGESQLSEESYNLGKQLRDTFYPDEYSYIFDAPYVPATTDAPKVSQAQAAQRSVEVAHERDTLVAAVHESFDVQIASLRAELHAKEAEVRQAHDAEVARIHAEAQAGTHA